MYAAGKARSVKNKTRNAELNGNRNPEWWGNLGQLVKIEKFKFLGIWRYKVQLRFWLCLYSGVSCNTKFELRFLVDLNLQFTKISPPCRACFPWNMMLVCEHLPRLGYGGLTLRILLSLCTPLHLCSSNDVCILLSLCLPRLLWNDVSPSKIPQGAVPVPISCQCCLASFFCTYVV